MDLRIADTFTDSLAKLTGDEQKAVKTTAFDLQMNPANPGMQFHKLDKGRDRNFWSVRVSSDIRLIVHKTQASLLLCYVDHHDKAYSWAERRKLETHPTTGAAQLVEIRETVREIIVPKYVDEEQVAPPKPLLFSTKEDDELLSYGVPEEWLDDVRRVDEDSLLVLADRLPAEAAEALLELACGGTPRVLQHTGPSTDPFEHPDALRRFRVMTNVEELERALDAPWDKWTIFLHPEQRDLVAREHSGPARVSGSAGTGKTVVALHRAVHLARAHEDSRVLLTTFSDTLANALRTKLRRLISGEPKLAERMDVAGLTTVGLRLHKALIGPVNVADSAEVRRLLKVASDEVGGHKFSLTFLVAEWEQVVDAWQLASWEDYRDVARLGRKTRLQEAHRKILWSIFEKVRSALTAQKLSTHAEMFTAVAQVLGAQNSKPFDFAIIDEAQDISVAGLRFLAALGAGRPNSLFFAADMGQRIFQQPFSWKSVGVDIRGRSRNLRVNYRTSHQIRSQADRLLGPEVSDVDGNVDDRRDTISVFNGPPPMIHLSVDSDAEVAFVAEWLSARGQEGVAPHEMGVFVRSDAELSRAQSALERAAIPFKVLDERVETTGGYASVCTMHLAKGLEFRVVVVMACDDEVLPQQSRIEAVGDEADLQDVYDTERQLLYVACTRARDQLLVSGVAPGSEFLDDLESRPEGPRDRSQ